MFTYLPPIPFAILAFTASAVLMFYIFKGWGKHRKNMMIFLCCCIPVGILSGVHKLVVAYSYDEMLKGILSAILITCVYILIGILTFIIFREIKTNPKVNVKLAKTSVLIMIFCASVLGIILLSKFFT